MTWSERQRPAVLLLAHLLPWPLHGGGQMKSFHALRALATRYDVTLLSFVRRPSEAYDLGPLPDLCPGGIRTVPLPRHRGRDAWHLLRTLGGSDSVVIARDSSPAMRAAVAEETALRPYAVVHADHLPMAQYLPPGGAASPRLLLDAHNVEHLLWRRMALAEGGSHLLRRFAGHDWPRLRAFEADAVRRADRTLAVSDADADAFRALVPEAADRIAVTPIGVDTDYFRPAPVGLDAESELLTFGTLYWPPNVEGLRWFCAEVLPRLRAARPDASLTVVGAKPNREARELAAVPGVRLVPDAPDVRPFAAGGPVFVAPLRSGGGVRVKILCALAMGIPVVTTTVGAEGIGVESGVHLLIADTADAFAEAVLRLRSDRALASRLGGNGRAFVERHHSPAAAGAALLAAYDSLLGAAAGGRAAA